IGLDDDTLHDLIPGGSLVEIDRTERSVINWAWTTLTERPIYFLWHDQGHACCWCDQTGNTLTILPHPLSRSRTKQLRVPREVTVTGRVTNSWRVIKPAEGIAEPPLYKMTAKSL